MKKGDRVKVDKSWSPLNPLRMPDDFTGPLDERGWPILTPSQGDNGVDSSDVPSASCSEDEHAANL